MAVPAFYQNLDIISAPEAHQYDYQNKYLFLRLDINTPIDNAGLISHEIRLERALKTIRHFQTLGAHIILCSHLGRPNGKTDPLYSLAPIADYLRHALQTDIPLISINSLPYECQRKTPLFLLENIRFLPEEKQNSASFATYLAQYIDLYINDAFSVSHRQEMSIDALCRAAPQSFAGPNMIKELEHITKFIYQPNRPVLVILGGAKLDTKLPLISQLLSVADHILVGGGIANTLLAHQGIDIGESYAQRDCPVPVAVSQAIQCRKIILPIDYVITDSSMAHNQIGTIHTTLPHNSRIVDIGPETQSMFDRYIAGAHTLFWNGPLGYFEKHPFDRGTEHIAQSCASAQAYTIAGGGETLWAIQRSQTAEKFSWLSSGGGALLDFISTGTLPGLNALLSRLNK